MNIDRKLATVRHISALTPIEGADLIEVATVDGWNVVVKKGEFHVGGLATYLEIDSWVPHELAPFLTQPGHEPKVFEGIAGQRLRTKKIRGVISQGLLLPTSFNCIEGDDLTDILGIKKWEKPVPAQLAGQVKGNFPGFLRKTDQPRIQNVFKDISKQDGIWEVTEKLDGSSMTVYLYNDPDGLKSGVCSRNLDLKPDPANAFWSVVFRDDIINKMTSLRRSLALQGELIGPGVQGNPYQLSQLEFHVFDIFDIDGQQYISADERQVICRNIGLTHVPIVGYLSLRKLNTVTGETSLTESLQGILEYAEDKSLVNPKVEREGLVWKSIENPSVSFKAISNKWLLKEKE